MRIIQLRFIVRTLILVCIKFLYRSIPATYSFTDKKTSRKLEYDDNTNLPKELSKFQKAQSNPAKWYSVLSQGYTVQRINFLPIFLSGLDKKFPSILDVGGGFGSTKMACQYLNNQEIKLTILELEGIVDLTKQSRQKNVEFVTQFPEDFFDIVYLGSSLQYFEHTDAILNQISNSKPDYIMIADSTFSEGNSFKVLQTNLPYSKINRWVLSESEISDYLKTYTLIHKSINYAPMHSFRSRKYPKIRTIHGNLIYKRKTT
jgi:putative methyltransferase (TIGR04325 family)